MFIEYFDVERILCPTFALLSLSNKEWYYSVGILPFQEPGCKESDACVIKIVVM